MKTTEEFDGFPREGVKFLRDLSRNNNREWFNKHKTVYEKSLVTPAKNFVTAMGDRLKEISPKITANPAVNQSLFRLIGNKDTSRHPQQKVHGLRLQMVQENGPAPAVDREISLEG